VAESNVWADYLIDTAYLDEAYQEGQSQSYADAMAQLALEHPTPWASRAAADAQAEADRIDETATRRRERIEARANAQRQFDTAQSDAQLAHSTQQTAAQATFTTAQSDAQLIRAQSESTNNQTQANNAAATDPTPADETPTDLYPPQPATTDAYGGTPGADWAKNYDFAGGLGDVEQEQLDPAATDDVLKLPDEVRNEAIGSMVSQWARQMMQDTPPERWAAEVDRYIRQFAWHDVPLPPEIVGKLRAWISAEQTRQLEVNQWVEAIRNPGARAVQISQDQARLNYYRAVMAEMIEVGDLLFNGGIRALRKKKGYWFWDTSESHCTDKPGWRMSLDGSTYASESALYVQRPDAARNPFPINWPRLSEAMQYSLDHYDTITFWNVYIWDYSSTNLPLIPGICIDRQSFDASERDAIEKMIHEPQHDWYEGGRKGMRALGGIGHYYIREIVGPSRNYGQRIYQYTPSSPTGKTDFDLFYDFLQNCQIAVRTVGGENLYISLWQVLLRAARQRAGWLGS